MKNLIDARERLLAATRWLIDLPIAYSNDLTVKAFDLSALAHAEMQKSTHNGKMIAKLVVGIEEHYDKIVDYGITATGF
jgi:hypothetical protein